MKLTTGQPLRDYFNEHVELIEKFVGGSRARYRVTKPLHVFKKTHERMHDAITNLIIPVGAKVHADLDGFDELCSADLRKMRASEAIVVSSARVRSRKPCKTPPNSSFDPRFKYVDGTIVKPFGNPFFNGPGTCAAGIHFFLNLQDALDY